MKFLWTAIYVKDLDESISFYSETTGLQVIRRFSVGPTTEIAMMGNGIGNETLVELLADRDKKPTAYGDFVSVGFAVESMEAMMETVKSKNIPLHSGPFETPGSKYFCIKDPNGLTVQFFQFK